MQLPRSLRAWGTEAFPEVLREEIAAIEIAELPLQQGLTTSSHVVDRPPQVMILGLAEEPDALLITAGLFYAGVVAGCNCADDPTPMEENPEYCEVRFRIDRESGAASVALLPDS